MEELGRRCAAAAPEVAVVVSPHSVHVEGHFAVVTAGKVGEWETDVALAAALLETPLPILGVSYGGNDPAAAEFPLDWGTEVPLAFMRAPGVVVVAPARDRPLEEHVQLGRVLASNSLLQGKRVALIASADHGHAHDPDGPYGFDPAAAAYDERLLEILASGRLDFLPLAELVEPAKADSLWQLLVLQGAVGESARADVLAYAAPTYYGMLVAEVQTAA
ncbi:MAG: extradiol ring-cleavage dioxygenase [Actinobacteria bacterium]|nr:MAG: extradiol ring-cleavage dioxygenase [Actinomycetota bacterium]